VIKKRVVQGRLQVEDEDKIKEQSLSRFRAVLQERMEMIRNVVESIEYPIQQRKAHGNCPNKYCCRPC
jgi:hypothetical protein